MLWEVKNAAGYDVLHLAIATGHLSVVYPLIAERPYYRDRLTPVPLEIYVTDVDWSRLSGALQRGLRRPDIQECSVRLHQEVEKPAATIDLAVVRSCVVRGADLLYVPGGMKYPTLHRCVLNNHVEALKLLMETRRDVDFTATDKDRMFARNVLHYVASRTSAEARGMLTAIIDRLATHSNDRVEWGQKHREKRDFLGVAANCGLLSDLYPLVKKVPYYQHAAKPLVLSSKVEDEDWARLSGEEQSELKRP